MSSFAWPKYAPVASPVASSSRLPVALDVPPSEGPTSPGSNAAHSQAPPSPSAGSVMSEAAGGDRSGVGKRVRSRGLRDPVVFKTPKPGYVIQSPDGSAFTRSMIQHDMLQALFANEVQAFTPPAGVELPPHLHGRQLLTFREAYEEDYINSSKITKRVRESMRLDSGFAKDHMMVAILVNAGKINTTAAFYPEMKTLIRHYHSVPSIQKTEMSKALLQDSPRLKACLRGVEIPTDEGAPPYTLAEVEAKSAQGIRPSTSMCNLIFTFTGASTELGERHLPRGLDFFDLLMANNDKHTIPSAQRARALLWLLWRYHEGAHIPVNPFDDDFSAAHPGQAPGLANVGVEELRLRHENVDLDDELRWGYEMEDKRRADMVVLKETGGVGRGKKGEKRPAFNSGSFKAKKARKDVMEDIEAELEAMSATDGGGPDDSSVHRGDKTFDFDDDEDELEEEIDELLEEPQSPVKPPLFVPTLDISYYMDPLPAGPPRDKRLLHLAYSQARATIDNPCYDSDEDDEDDDQALHDLRIKIGVLRESQRVNGHVPRPPPAPSPAPADAPDALVDGSDAAPPSFEPVPGAVPGGGIPKLKLTFGGGGKKSSLSALLN